MSGENKFEMLLIMLNGICEDATGAAHEDPEANLDCLYSLEAMGVVIPPYLRQAVIEFVNHHSEKTEEGED